ncbi:hypothetical protein RFI_10089, partial [Reticulomyxa filosa]
MLLIGNPLLDALMWCYFKYLPERRVKKQQKKSQKKGPGKHGDYQQLSEEKKEDEDEEDEEDEEEEEEENDNDNKNNNSDSRVEMGHLKNRKKISKKKYANYASKNLPHNDASELLLADISEDQQELMLASHMSHMRRLQKDQDQIEKTISDALRKE